MEGTVIPISRYCNSLTQYSRLKTREVLIGDLPLGGDNPIRVQSMTTADTMNTEATVAESIRMIEAGCELVRITAPSIKEAENLAEIKNRLRSTGFNTPLVADIHFTPNAAELAARIVEKVRVNPGNYADKKKFEDIEYTDQAYQAELERIKERFAPLVNICRENGTAMRIGTNHGSLSDRIMSRYGDTPLGMVESAMEFLRICRDMDFHNLVISMKASNPQVMVQAYRLLVVTMLRENMNYPLHLGVTEAGDGDDGRIKSAVGIGTLLEDGIGDTIRVSLTEPPEAEIPVAQMIVNRYIHRSGHKRIPEIQGELPYSPFSYQRRKSNEIFNIGGKNVPVVIATMPRMDIITQASLFPLGYRYSVPLDKWNLSDQACDYCYTGSKGVAFELPGTLGIIVDGNAYPQWKERPRHYPLISFAEWQKGLYSTIPMVFVSVSTDELMQGLNPDNGNPNPVFILHTDNDHAVASLRRAFIEMMQKEYNFPVIIQRTYASDDCSEFQLYAATDSGALLLDGMGDGVWINTSGQISQMTINQTAFNILQATRTRISKTEYISCPSCGRTLFDLQETTAKIRARTHHLKGVKIGIMGCIVNGPGEMADADYGYVGTGPGKINLYREKTVVKRNVPEECAVEELIELIRLNGDWVEP